MMPDSAHTPITQRPCPEWSGFGPTLQRLGELFLTLQVIICAVDSYFTSSTFKSTF